MGAMGPKSNTPSDSRPRICIRDGNVVASNGTKTVLKPEIYYGLYQSTLYAPQSLAAVPRITAERRTSSIVVVWQRDSNRFVLWRVLTYFAIRR
jgi:hypothetical protein